MFSKISKLLIFLLVPFYLFPQSDLRVLYSDSRSATVEYTPKFLDTSVVKIGSETFKRFVVRNGFPLNNEAGLPDVNARLVNLGVPAEFGNTITIIKSDYRTISGKLVPVASADENEDGLPEYQYELGADYYSWSDDSEPVNFGEFGYVRSLPVQSFLVRPVQYNASAGTIKIYTKIIFKVNFAAAKSINGSPEKDDLLEEVVINYETAKFWRKQKNRLNKTVTNSVLSSGTWYRFETEAEGIYKITHSMLQSYGIDPAGVDPKTIKIYNNGGMHLPESQTAAYPTEPVENAIIVVGEEDGRFDAGDYILFYGRGTEFWYIGENNSIIRTQHKYSAKNYYWITSGGSTGKRMTAKAGQNAQPDMVVNSTPAFKHYEQELISIAKSGRNFFGDEFDNTNKSRTYMTTLEGLVSGQPIKYKGAFVNTDTRTVLLTVEESSSVLFNANIQSKAPRYSFGAMSLFSGTYSGALQQNRSLLKITYNAVNASSKGYLDFLEIQYVRNLSAEGNQVIFYSPDSTGLIEYPLNGFSSSGIYVFDVTDYSEVKRITNPSVHSGSEFKFRVNETSGAKSKYLAVEQSAFLTPANPVKMENSNVKGIKTGGKLILITNKEFKTQAEQFKQYKETELTLPVSTEVVYQEDIFNEFSGGLPDPSAIRNFIRHAYENWEVTPEHVLLFGDGTYDYKNIEGGNQNKNFVITFQTVESLNEISSSTYDDYFARISGNDKKTDISLGRLPIQTPEDARIIMNKIRQYETGNTGLWRNTITFVSDDAYAEGWEGSLHSQPSEDVARSLPESFNITKIYLSAYETVITSSGRRIPEANREIIKAMNDGCVIVNYVGHGNPRVWAHEQVFDKDASIQQLNNTDYFFLTAATCDFGDFDKPLLQSGAEELLLKENAGAIGSFTAARLVYAQYNVTLMETLFEKMFSMTRDTLNYMAPIGTIVFSTKQDRYNDNDQKYHIIGDPTIRLNIPHYTAMIDSINGVSTDTLTGIKALSTVSVKGHIVSPGGGIWSGFNGEGILSVYDSNREFMLKYDNVNLHNVLMRGGPIFKGRISVVNGAYEASFVVPKDISYANKQGKIVLYFTGENSDGIGFSSSFIVGGTDTTAVNDNSGPEMEIFFDDINSASSNLANPNSTLIIKLFDQSGLNTTGTGIGHKLEGILNDDINNPIDFTEYFIGDVNAGGKSGKVEYKLNGLDLGEYKLDIKAWDVFNNYSAESAYFSVVSGDQLVIRDVYNYPNPFVSNTVFTFQQNLNRVIDVKIKIYTVAGRLIKNIEQFSLSDKFVKVDWDGRDEDGNIIANGTYLYKIIVKTTDGEYSESVLGKLAVIR